MLNLVIRKDTGLLSNVNQADTDDQFRTTHDEKLLNVGATNLLRSQRIRIVTGVTKKTNTCSEEFLHKANWKTKEVGK